MRSPRALSLVSFAIALVDSLSARTPPPVSPPPPPPPPPPRAPRAIAPIASTLSLLFHISTVSFHSLHFPRVIHSISQSRTSHSQSHSHTHRQRSSSLHHRHREKRRDVRDVSPRSFVRAIETFSQHLFHSLCAIEPGRRVTSTLGTFGFKSNRFAIATNRMPMGNQIKSNGEWRIESNRIANGEYEYVS